MASTLVKLAAKQVMGKQMKQYQSKKVGGPTDPYFTQITDPRTGKTKKVKKQIPDYIPDHDAVILAKMRNRSYKLDMCLFDFAGIRFGYSSVIGIIPAFGDVADSLMALLLVWRCTKIECGLGSGVLLQMLINVAIDFVIGLVPLLGDIADAAFKANTKNVRVLEKRLDEVYKPKGLKSQDAERIKKVKEERRRTGMRYEAAYEDQPATVIEELSDDEDAEERRRYVEQSKADERATTAGGKLAKPQKSVANDGEPRRGSWYNGFAKSSDRDVERGTASAPVRPQRPVV